MNGPHALFTHTLSLNHLSMLLILKLLRSLKYYLYTNKDIECKICMILLQIWILFEWNFIGLGETMFYSKILKNFVYIFVLKNCCLMSSVLDTSQWSQERIFTMLLYLFLISLLKSQLELSDSSCVLLFVSVIIANKYLHAKLDPWLQMKFHYFQIMFSVITP